MSLKLVALFKEVRKNQPAGLLLLVSLGVNFFTPAAGIADASIKAKVIARSLHDSFEDNLGFSYLQTLYDSLHCVKKDLNAKTVLRKLVQPATARLQVFSTALQKYNIVAENVSVVTGKENIATDCCRTTSTHYSDRFHASVDLSSACVVNKGNGSLVMELVGGFSKTLNDSSDVLWQYYGSIDGEYLQFPASRRYCNGSSSQFDPRFMAWYVETASPVKKNLVIIIDRSGSMRRGSRMKLAIEAALTVLDTLSSQDNVGILAFSHRIETPLGCFGKTVAKGTPANLNKLREWVQKLRATGSTWYAPALRHAFSMFQNATSNETSEGSNVILFLTDGNPSDTKESDIFQAIEENQDKMNHSVQINTYALGRGITPAGLQRLRHIASNNSGIFKEIKDQQGGLLKRVMGSYYTSIKTSYKHEHRISDPRRDPKLGLIVTISLALTRNGALRGVVALDFLLERVFKEALKVPAGPLSYAILVDSQGRALLHPYLPANISSQSFLSLSLLEPHLPPEVVSNMTGKGAGFGRFQTSFPLPRGDRARDGTQIFPANGTYLWSPVESSIYSIVLVVVNGPQNVRINLKSYNPLSQSIKSFYHRLDLTWNTSVYHSDDVCILNGHLTAPTASTVKIAPTAFRDNDKYIYTTETLEDVSCIENFFDDNSSNGDDIGLTPDLRMEVLLTWELERIWKMANKRDPSAVQWRFVGTQNGVLRMYPGLRFHKAYTHKQQSWYRQALLKAGTLVLSSATATYQQDKLISFSKTILKTRCLSSRSSYKIGDVIAVMGMQMTAMAFLQLINDNSGLNLRNQTDWYLLENHGRILLNLSSTQQSTASELHLTTAFPWLASTLIRKHKALKGSWCNNYEQHTVEFSYELSVDPSGASSNTMEPCRQFAMHPVPGTSLYLLGLPSRRLHHCIEFPQGPHEECHCGTSCGICSSSDDFICQCPCWCSMSYDDCENSVKAQLTPILCPVPPASLYETEKENFALQQAMLHVPTCASDCRQIQNVTGCVKTEGCHWCVFSPMPSCSSECRTNQSSSMVIQFPCNNFLNLSTTQREEVEYLIKRVLMRGIPILSHLSFGLLRLLQEGALLELYATTSNSDLKLVQQKVREMIEEGNVAVGSSSGLMYSAKTSKQFTDLWITLSLDPSLPKLSEEITNISRVELQSLLVSLLGESFFSVIRNFRMNKTSVQFSLSNDGRTDLYPIQNVNAVLKKAVLAGRLSFHIPSVMDHGSSEEFSVRSIASYGAFDFLCSPATSTPVTETRATITRNPSTTITGWSRTATPSKHDVGREMGLTPVVIAILTTAVVFTLILCHCILYVVLTKRRRKTQDTKVYPGDEPEEELPSDVSQLSTLEPDMNILINEAYSACPTRIALSPRVAWAKTKILTTPSPQNIPEGAFF